MVVRAFDLVVGARRPVPFTWLICSDATITPIEFTTLRQLGGAVTRYKLAMAFFGTSMGFWARLGFIATQTTFRMPETCIGRIFASPIVQTRRGLKTHFSRWHADALPIRILFARKPRRTFGIGLASLHAPLMQLHANL